MSRVRMAVIQPLGCGFFMAGDGEKFGESFAESSGFEVSFDRVAVAKGDDAIFLADDDDDGVGFLAEAEGGAVSEAELAV